MRTDTKRTMKRGKETAKSAQQPAFRTPAQELEDFKAKVLAMKHGAVIWMSLTMYDVDDQRLLSEWVEMILAPFPAMLRQYFPNTCTDNRLAAPLGDELLGAAMHEVENKTDELWPEYKHLLERNPDELKAYRERYNQNRLPPDFAIRPRELPQRGRPRKQTLAERDAQIVYMKDVQNYSFGQIAQKLNMGREVCESAYYRMKVNRL